MIEGPCGCGAHRLHRVFAYAWTHPSATRAECAHDLKMSLSNCWQAFHLLKKRDLSRTCPECFSQQLLRGVCQSCGYEPYAPALPMEILAASQQPTNNLFPGNELGSDVDWSKLRFGNHPVIIKRRMERGVEDSLALGVKSDVMDELKRAYPSEEITDEAGRLCVKEVAEFRSRYPQLSTAARLRKQLAENVVNRLVLFHPQLRTALRVQAVQVVPAMEDTPAIFELATA